MNLNSKIFVAGGNGLVGSAIIKNLISKGYQNIISSYNSRKPNIENTYCKYVSLDLLDSNKTEAFFKENKPEIVFLAAAKVGGIMANNTYRAQFIYENLQIQNNIIHQSYLNKVKKLLFLGSSCIYPKNCPQPMKEKYLLTGELEYTNEPYAIAKIAGIKMVESYNLQYGTNFLSVMPTNLYGPNDNFDLDNSHVLPAMIRKIFLAKLLEENRIKEIRENFENLPPKSFDKNFTDIQLISFLKDNYGINKNEDQKVSISLWGTGTPKREFLHSEDMADACVYIMERIDFKDTYNQIENKQVRNTHFNIGTGIDLSIKELALSIAKIADFKGEIKWNTEKPDGTMQKLLDVSKLKNIGWSAKIELFDGIKNIFDLYTKKA